MSEDFTRIANALERIAGALEHLHIEKIDHAHIDDIGEIHGDVSFMTHLLSNQYEHDVLEQSYLIVR